LINNSNNDNNNNNNNNNNNRNLINMSFVLASLQKIIGDTYLKVLLNTKSNLKIIYLSEALEPTGSYLPELILASIA